MKKYNLAITVVTCLLASSAFAGGASPFYMGVSIGQSHVDNDASQFDTGGFCDGTKGHYHDECRIGDGSDAGHIYGGFRFTDNLAIEAGYADLGTTASYHYTDPIKATQETKGATLAGVGRYRLGKASPLLVYGKAGVFAWKSEVDSKGSHHELPTGSTDDTGVDPMVGAGLEYEVTHNVSVRAGWDRYYNVGENDTLLTVGGDKKEGSVNTLETDVDVYSAGINFSFY